MDKKYRIGFYAAFFLFVLLIGFGYRASYRYAQQHALAMESRENAKSADAQNTEALTEERTSEENQKSVAAGGDAKKGRGYLLLPLEGYVAVYYADGETLYELTDIPVDSLPDELCTQLKAGKYMEDEKELYGFLENYSS